jgi:hypothetical protein
MALLADDLAGNPVTAQRWIRRSLSSLQTALRAEGYHLSCNTIRRLLLKHDIRPKSNVKRLHPQPHMDRDRQFDYIQTQRQRFAGAALPIISVDTKKRELIGLFYQAGQTWNASAPSVYLHDFPSDASGKAIPYGIYDVQLNRGYVYVGLSADTPDFAVSALVQWWQQYGQPSYPQASELLILADGGGSNGYRPRRWKYQLQVQLVDAFELPVTVCHYPPGASKWNPIEHRLFSQISKTWAGTPLTSLEVILACMRATQTTTGLTVEATLIGQVFATGLTVSDDEMAALAIEKHATCPQWNYTIKPRKTGK